MKFAFFSRFSLKDKLALSFGLPAFILVICFVMFTVKSRENQLLLNQLMALDTGPFHAKMQTILDNSRTMDQFIFLTVFSGALAIIFILWTMFLRTIKPMDQTISGLRLNSEQLAAIAAKVSVSSSVLSASALEQGHRMQDTARCVGELLEGFNHNREYAKKVKRLSEDNEHAVTNGEKEITNLTQQMRSIAESTQEVESIIGVIDDIAFQTNILALNAAVEAARAGEHGKGFAVVAEAIRNLALKSSTSAKQINRLVKQSSEKVAVGCTRAENCVENLKEVVRSAHDIASLSSLVDSTTQIQSVSLNQMGGVVARLDQTFRDTTVSAHESAEVSEAMFFQARKLETMIAGLAAIIRGKSRSYFGESGKSSAGNVFLMPPLDSDQVGPEPAESGISRSNSKIS